MKLKYLCIYIFIALLSLTTVGCISVKYPQRQQYMLTVPLPAHTKAQSRRANKILEINNLEVAPQFAGLSFVYRTSNINYTKDYYNIFFNSPAQQLEQNIVNYLEAKNLFNYVINDAGALQPDYILHAKVRALYADYRNPKYPKAVLTVHFILYAPNRINRVFLHKTYYAAVLLRRKDTPSLIYAWQRGLQKILAQLNYDLNRLSSTL